MVLREIIATQLKKSQLGVHNHLLIDRYHDFSTNCSAQSLSFGSFLFKHLKDNLILVIL